MKLKTVLIILLLIVIVCFFLWLKICRKKPVEESPVSILNSHGEVVGEINPMDTVFVSVKKLKPATLYDIRVMRSDNKEISYARLLTDLRGEIPPTPIWYDVGVEYMEGYRAGKLNFEEVINHKYRLVVSSPEQKFEFPFKIIDIKLKPRIYSADENGNPLNGFIRGREDVYAVGKNLPAGSTIHLYVVEDRYRWADGDLLNPVTKKYVTVNLESNQTEFKVQVWEKHAAIIGGYDIIADCMPFDGCYFEHTDPNDGDCNIGFCIQDEGAADDIEQKMTCQAPSPPPPAAPNPKYKDTFSPSEAVWVAINPIVQGQNYAGKNAKIYVINQLPKSSYAHGMTLTDVTGGPKTTVIQPGCANVNYNLIWANPVAGKYDVVIDFPPFGVYDKGTDIVDMMDPVGLLVGDPDIEVRRIKFNWGVGSGAVNLKDHVTNALVPVPEWDKTINRSEPAAYTRGTVITIKAQFYKLSSTAPDAVVIWADLGQGITLLPQTVNFAGASESAYVDFTTAVPSPNYINKNDFVWQWYYAVPPYPGSVQNPMNSHSHTICTTFLASLVNPAYKEPMLWTSEWAKYWSNEKGICDSIISKLYLSGLKYGISNPYGDVIDGVLDQGGGMCGSWYQMFAHMAGCQGVFVNQKFYQLKNDAAPSPEVKWYAIVIKDGGLNQPQPTHAAQNFNDVDSVYPNPSQSDITIRNEKRYVFSSGDGHCINFLDYQGKLYLYDPSFGKGPFDNTFTALPSGDTTGTALTNFRANYHDKAIDYMKGYIKLGDGTHKSLTIKTTLIPDLRNSSDPSTFEIHYKWY